MSVRTATMGSWRKSGVGYPMSDMAEITALHARLTTCGKHLSLYEESIHLNKH